MIDVDDVDPMPENDDQTPEDDRSAADTPQDDDADNSEGDGDDAPQDEDDDIIEPLPGLPHEDYGREFDAPPPSAPLAVARHIYRLFHIDGCRSLLSWRGGWMRWYITHWSELDAAQLRSHVYRSMSEATYEHVTANGVETRSWNPDKRKVANVIEAMDALAHFPSDIDPPSWIAT